MARMSYKTALRAKGFKPIPSVNRLRSSLSPTGQDDVCIDATASALRERVAA